MSTNKTDAERAEFELWLLDHQGLDGTWNEQRNCYDEFPAHLAYKAWQAATCLKAPAAQPDIGDYVLKRESNRMINALIQGSVLPDASIELLRSLFPEQTPVAQEPVRWRVKQSDGSTLDCFDTQAEAEGLAVPKHGETVEALYAARHHAPSNVNEELTSLPEPIAHLALEDWQGGLRDADLLSRKPRGDTTPLFTDEQMQSYAAPHHESAEARFLGADKPEKYGVHAAHCCARHGCKYGYDDCPVMLGKVKQEYPCEQCAQEPEPAQDEAIARDARRYRKLILAADRASAASAVCCITVDPENEPRHLYAEAEIGDFLDGLDIYSFLADKEPKP